MILVWYGSINGLWPSLSPGMACHRATTMRLEQSCEAWRGIPAACSAWNAHALLL